MAAVPRVATDKKKKSMHSHCQPGAKVFQSDLHCILLATVGAVTAEVSEGLWFVGHGGPEVGRQQHFVTAVWNSNTPFLSLCTLVAGLLSVSCRSVDAEGAKKRW